MKIFTHLSKIIFLVFIQNSFLSASDNSIDNSLEISIPLKVDSSKEEFENYFNKYIALLDIDNFILGSHNQFRVDILLGNLKNKPENYDDFVKAIILYYASQYEPKHLRVLNLSYCHLTKLPDEIFLFSNLGSLLLSNNQLRELPEDIDKLSKLKTIYLGANELESLPQSFGKLSKLTTLYLQDNKISRLPNSFGQLSNLVELYIDFEEDPNFDCLKNFIKLRSLTIGGKFVDSERNIDIIKGELLPFFKEKNQHFRLSFR